MFCSPTYYLIMLGNFKSLAHYKFKIYTKYKVRWKQTRNSRMMNLSDIKEYGSQIDDT